MPVDNIYRPQTPVLGIKPPVFILTCEYKKPLPIFRKRLHLATLLLAKELYYYPTPVIPVLMPLPPL